MTILSLVIKNFRSITEQSLDLLPGVTVISGPNGSGKSSIFYALIYALWGTRNVKPLVQAGQRTMSVQAEIRVGDSVLKIIRTHTQSGKAFVPRLQLTLNGQDATTAQIEETQRLINKYVGTEGSAYSTFLIRQGHLKEFIEAKPALRRDVLSKLLALSPLWDVLYKDFQGVVKTTEAALNTTVERLRIRNQDLEDTVAPDLLEQKKESKRKELEGHSKSYEEQAELEKYYTEKQAASKSILESINVLRHSCLTIEQEVTNTRQRINDLIKERGSAEEIDKRIAALEEEKKTKVVPDSNVADLEAKVDEYTKATQADELELQQLKGRKRELQGSALYTQWQSLINDYLTSTTGDLCFTCKQEIKPEHLDRIVGGLRERAAKLAEEFGLTSVDITSQANLDKSKAARDRQITAIDEAITATENLLEKHRGQQLAFTRSRDDKRAAARKVTAELDLINSRIRTAERAKAELDNVNTRINGLEERITAAEERWAGEKTKLENQEALLGDETSYDEQLRQAREKKSYYNNRVAELKQDIRAADEALNNRKQLEKQISELEAAEIKGRAELRRVQLTSQTLAPSGARQLILDRKLVEIQNLANEYLTRLDDEMSVIFSTQRSSGVETLDILVSKESMRPIETYSGGEQTRLAFVLRLAFLSVLAKRMTQTLLLLDEPFGDQDPYKSELMNSLILQIGANYKQVFIISHSSALINGTDQRIEL